MHNNYSIPDNYSLRSADGMWFAESWGDFTSDVLLPSFPSIPLFYGNDLEAGPHESMVTDSTKNPWGFWYSTSNKTNPKLGISNKHCNNWTSSEESNHGHVGGNTFNFQYMDTPPYFQNLSSSGMNYSKVYVGRGHLYEEVSCSQRRPLVCICW